MKSSTLRSCYRSWQTTATPAQLQFVDETYALCEEHYSAGGDTIVECFTPTEIIEEFSNLDEVRQYCGLKVEQALNARWGEDDDPEVQRHEQFEEWDHGCKDDNHFFGRE